MGVIPFVLLAAEEKKAEKGDLATNPPYKNWSAFKVGTTAIVKETLIDKSGDDPNAVDATARPEYPPVNVMTYTLLQVTPEKAVVELRQTEIEANSETEHAPVKITYPAKISKKYAGQILSKEKVGNFKEEEEMVEAAGKKIDCHKIHSEIKVGDETSISTIWHSDNVPGGIVKQKTIKKQGDKVLFESTRELIGIKEGKE
jgi:hypothetical protein